MTRSSGNRPDTHAAPSRSTALLCFLALVWGFAEATLFFIVPDVLTTAGGVARTRSGLAAVPFALVGALIGGTVMHVWTHHDANSTVSMVMRTPGATPERLHRAEADLRTHGAVGMLVGGVSFLPYKLYGVASATQDMPLRTFLLCSTLARGARFTLTTLLAAWIAHGPLKRWTLRRKLLVHACMWTAIYGVYFAFIA